MTNIRGQQMARRVLARPSPPTEGLTAFWEQYPGLDKAMRERQCLQSPWVTHCVALNKGLLSLASFSLSEDWAEWALQLGGSCELCVLGSSRHLAAV